MKPKILNQFLGSFVIFPIITLSIPFSGTGASNLEYQYPKVAFVEKTNTVISEFINFNQVGSSEIDELTEGRKAKASVIDAYFVAKDMPLSGYGMQMVIEAEKNNIDWRLLPAISVIETTGGKFMCKNPKAPNNPFGWGSCRIGFKSIEHAIETVAFNLGGNNPKTERYYKDKTLEEIIDSYNPPEIVPNYKAKILKVINSFILN